MKRHRAQSSVTTAMLSETQTLVECMLMSSCVIHETVALPGDSEDDSNADDNFLSVTLHTLTPLMPTAYICHILLLSLTFIDQRLRKE